MVFGAYYLKKNNFFTYGKNITYVIFLYFIILHYSDDNVVYEK